MEKLRKTAYLVGIGMAVSVFTIFMLAFVPIAIDETTHRLGLYDRVSKEVVLAKLQEHPAYVAMYERFPDAAEEFVERTNRASLNVGVMDFDVGNQLVLHLHYDGYDDSVDVTWSAWRVPGFATINRRLVRRRLHQGHRLRDRGRLRGTPPGHGWQRRLARPSRSPTQSDGPISAANRYAFCTSMPRGGDARGRQADQKRLSRHYAHALLRHACLCAGGLWHVSRIGCCRGDIDLRGMPTLHKICSRRLK